MNIPKEAIDAAAEALEKRAENDDWEWCLGDAQAALEAAAPWLRAQALTEAADDGWKAMLVVASRKQMVPGADDFRDWLRARAVTERGEG